MLGEIFHFNIKQQCFISNLFCKIFLACHFGLSFFILRSRKSGVGRIHTYLSDQTKTLLHHPIECYFININV